MITGAIAWASGHPGELTVVATTEAFAAHGQRMIEKAPADALSYRCTVFEHLSSLFKGGTRGNAQDQAHAAVYAMTVSLGAPYAVLTPSGVEVSGAETFNEFLKELLS